MDERTLLAERSLSAPSLPLELWRRSSAVLPRNREHWVRITMLMLPRINAAQLLGAPLALINEDWHNSWVAFNKQSWGLLITTLASWWSPTLVRVSGDKSVRGQLQRTIDGSLYCDFSERMVLIANHQVHMMH